MNVESKIKEIVEKHWPEEKPAPMDEVKLSKRIRFGVEVGMMLTELGIGHCYSEKFVEEAKRDELWKR